MIVGVVVEGNRDFPLFRAIIAEICPGVERVQVIHPPTDELAVGSPGAIHVTGWTGIRRWCQRFGPILTEYMQDYGDPLGLLVIAIDATVAHNPAIDLERPCPPASDTTDALRSRVAEWLGNQPPGDVVIVIPSKTADAWVCAAVVGGLADLECEPEPLELLRSVPLNQLGFKLKRDSNGKVKKPAARQYGYHLAPKVADRFGQVRAICGEADRFGARLQSLCDGGRGGF